MDDYFYAKMSQLEIQRQEVNEVYNLVASAFDMEVKEMLGHMYHARATPKIVIEARATMFCALRRLGYNRGETEKITNWSFRTVSRGYILHADLLKDDQYRKKWERIESAIDLMNGVHN